MLRSFRYYQLANVVALIGDQLGMVALSWWVLQQTDSVAIFANILVASTVARIIGLPLVAPIADRYHKRTVMLISDGIGAAVAFFTLGMMLFGKFHLGLFVLLSVASGLASACFRAAAAGIIPSLVERRDLPKAIAQNQSLLTLSQIVGAPLAGVLVAWIGDVQTWGLGIVCTFIAMVATAQLRFLRGSDRLLDGTNWLASLSTGCRFIRDRPLVWQSALFVCMALLALAPIAVVIPYLATRHPMTPSWYLGMLHGSVAAGSVLFALSLSWLDRRMGSLSMSVVGLLLAALALSCLAMDVGLVPSLICCLVFGMAEMMALVPLRSRVMAVIPRHLMSRVVSVLQALSQALVPFGLWIAGKGLAAYEPVVVHAPFVGLLISLSLIVIVVKPVASFLKTPVDEIEPAEFEDQRAGPHRPLIAKSA